MCIRDRYGVAPFVGEDINTLGFNVVRGRVSSPPVSYTHLDVYKRQPQQSAATKRPMATDLCQMAAGLCQMAAGLCQTVVELSLIHI